MIAQASWDHFHQIDVMRFLAANIIKCGGLDSHVILVRLVMSCFRPKEARMDLISL